MKYPVSILLALMIALVCLSGGCATEKEKDGTEQKNLGPSTMPAGARPPG